ncbi:MAG: NAD(P)H-dependent oxidoreductase [Candidatus Vogelbacteria bacterium]|nr:NAD(P)H-dependent oxidoreductase [Candidatus Vogelbacteria bacterium]
MKNISTMKIKIIVGSTRQNRFSEKPARWIYEKTKNTDDVETELLDLRDYPMPFFDEPVSPTMNKNGYPNETVKAWAQRIGEADGYIVVTPEYNHGYPAVLKNAMDYVYKEWNNKPIGFVSYGSVGGARSIEQLRQVAVELQMAPIRSAIHIPSFWMMLDAKGNLKEKAFDSLEGGAKKFLEQLLWWARALKNARNAIST